MNIPDFSEAKKCPRKVFLKNHLSSSKPKISILNSILDQILFKLDFNNITFENLYEIIKTTFKQNSKNMLSFEENDEIDTMTYLLIRYIKYERQLSSRKVLSANFSETITLCQKEYKIKINKLIDRGTYLESICYKYKKPEISYKGRTDFTNAQKSYKLLAIQKAGEKEAEKLKIDKPVFASIYYMKSKNDRENLYVNTFEEEKGKNIICMHFDKQQEKNIENILNDIKIDLNIKTNEIKNCNDCYYNDLCNTAFIKKTCKALPEKESINTSKIYLTKEQERLVNFIEGQCRVNAVAGSGKTTVITLRTLNLIKNGCNPNEILMITFSNKAKHEMKNRLYQYSNQEINIDDINVETFNSWGQNLIDQNYEKLGFKKPPIVVDDVLKTDIIINLLEIFNKLPLDYSNPFMNLKNAKGAITEITSILDKLKSYHVESIYDVRECLDYDKKFENYEETLLELYNKYNSELIKNNAIDYEDQLRLILKLKSFDTFQTLPYKHIMIDEFQDSNPNQINLISEIIFLNSNIKSLVVVGDDMQSIYGFRNANPENLINIKDHFPDMQDINLIENFRSETPIIKMANEILIKESKIPKIIHANKSNSDLKPVVLNFNDEQEEISLFTRQVKKLLLKGEPPSSIAILARTKTVLISIKQAFEAANIPVSLKVPETIGNSPYVKAIIGLANFLLDINNLTDLALYQKAINKNPFDSNDLEKNRISIKKSIDELHNENDKINFFFNLFEDIKNDYVAELFLNKLQDMNFTTFSELLQYCYKYRLYEIRENHVTHYENSETVTLITFHSAKGLEWDTVLMTIKKLSDTEEEKRLLYVGVTRAKEKLLIACKPNQTITKLLAV